MILIKKGFNAILLSWHVLHVSGNTNNDTNAGTFTFNCNNDSSNRNRNNGSQLAVSSKALNSCSMDGANMSTQYSLVA